MRDDRFRTPWALVGVVATAAVLFAMGIVIRTAGAPPLESGEAPATAEAGAAPSGRSEVRVPLARVERVIVTGRYEACALGGREAACTNDGGESWEHYGTLPAPAVAALGLGKGQVLFACLDGSLVEAGLGLEPLKRASLADEYALADAEAHEGHLFLLVHRYEEPEDPFLHLPRVIETAVVRVGPGSEKEWLGRLTGFGGDRILLQGGHSLITYTSVDQRAWKSKDGGRSFRRLPDEVRFGTDFDGLQVTVERRPEPLPGPGRKARPASALWISRDDGETWESTFETPGELLAEFADRRLGMAISRGEGVAWLTEDGGMSFEPLLHDDRLDDAMDLIWLGGRFLAMTKSGLALPLHP